jgi:hypothetical protein
MDTKEKRIELNIAAIKIPAVGDYWHEMYCPYFVIVNIQDDKYTILCAVTIEGATNAIVRHRDYCEFDYSKHSVVSIEWIKDIVSYKNAPGFVADVRRGWRPSLINEWQAANPNYVAEWAKKPLYEDWFLGV